MKTPEQILEDIFDYGKALYEFKIGDKYVIKIRNITANDYMEMDSALKENTMTQVGLAQTYIIERLSRIIISINNKEIGNVDKCKDILKAMPSPLVDRILVEHKSFEEMIKKATDPEEIEDAFFDKGASQES